MDAVNQLSYLRDINVQNLLFVLIIWLVLTATAVASVLSRNMDRTSKRSWIAMIILLPPIGLLAYLPFSLEDPKAVREWLGRMLRGRTLKTK